MAVETGFPSIGRRGGLFFVGCLFDFVALGVGTFFCKRVLIRVWAFIQGNITSVIVFGLFHMMCGMKNP